MRVWAQSSQRSTWPPSAAVRHISMAVMTRRWARLKWASFAARQPAPWRRKTSATSRIGRGIAGVSGRRWYLYVQKFERALDLPDGVDCHPCIACGGRDITMAEQILDHVNVDALFQKMGGEAVAQRMHGDRFIETRDLGCPAASSFHRARGDRPRRVGAGEQQVFQMSLLPIIAQDAEQLLRQHDIAILAPFGLPNSKDHPRAIDIAGGQLHGLGNTQTGGIDRNEQRSHSQVRYCLQQAHDFVSRQHGWQRVCPARIGTLLGYFLQPQCRAVEETQGAHNRVDRVWL